MDALAKAFAAPAQGIETERPRPPGVAGLADDTHAVAEFSQNPVVRDF
jgi:hypothetical protein